MRDRNLERKISDLQELIDKWNDFYGMMDAVKKGANFTEEHDKKFLNLKSSIARKFQAIADKFERKTFPDEEITNVLTEAVSLEDVNKMSSFTAGQLQNTWHRVYILLNKILGHLESERDSLGRINSIGHGIKKVIKNKLFIFLLIVSFICGGIFLGYRYYAVNIRPAIQQVETGTEASEASTELVKLTRDIRGLINDLREKAGKVEKGEEAKSVLHTYVVGNWISVIAMIVGAIACGWLASTKGKSPIIWSFLGLLCCPITFVVLLLKQ